MATDAVAEAFVTMRPEFRGFARETASGVKGALGTVGGALGGMLKTVGLATAGAASAATVSLAKVGIGYNDLEQKSRAAFTTILGSADAAHSMMDDIAEFGKTSPFPRQAFIQATQQLLGFGYEAQEIIPTLEVINDAVAAIGGGSAEIAQITDVFAKIRSGGRVMTDDLNRLSLVGINGFQMLAEHAGVSIADVRDMVKDGLFDADTALGVMTAGMQKKFAGASENVKKTWSGAMDRVKGAWRDTASLLVEPFVGRKGGGLGVQWANSLADGLRAAERVLKEGGGLGGVIELATTNAQKAISDALPGIKAKLLEWGSAFIEWVKPMIGPMLQRVGELLSALGGWVTGTAAPWLWTKVQEWGRAFIDWVTPYIGPMLEKAGELLNSLGTWILDTALPWIGDKLVEWGTAFATWVIDAAPGMFQALLDLLSDLGAWFEEKKPDLQRQLGVWTGELIVWVVDAIPKMMNALGDMLDSLLAWISGEAAPKTGDEADSIGEHFVNGVLEGIGDRMPNLREKVQGMLTRALRGLVGIRTQDELFPEDELREYIDQQINPGGGRGRSLDPPGLPRGVKMAGTTIIVNNPLREETKESVTRSLRTAQFLVGTS